MESPHLFNPSASFQLQTGVVFAWNLQSRDPLLKHLPSLAAFDPGLANGIYRGLSRPPTGRAEAAQATGYTTLHYTTAAGRCLMPDWSPLAVLTRARVRGRVDRGRSTGAGRSMPRTARSSAPRRPAYTAIDRAPSRSDALGPWGLAAGAGGVRMRLSLGGWWIIDVACAGGMSPARPRASVAVDAADLIGCRRRRRRTRGVLATRPAIGTTYTNTINHAYTRSIPRAC